MLKQMKFKRKIKNKNDIISNNFESAAFIHSISSTSQEGGNLGWIKESSLNLKIKSILKIQLEEILHHPSLYQVVF